MSRPEEHSRGTTRLEGYDYPLPGAYFVTLCTQNRECLYGVVEEDEVLLNDFGKIVDEEWRKTPLIRPDVELDTFVVMPNHLHGIIMIHERATAAGIDTQVVGATRRVAPTQYAGPDTDRPQTDPGRPKGAPSGSLGAIVGQFKSASARRINRARSAPGSAVWQRGFYEHVIRSEESFARIREYVAGNPAKWAEDEYNPHSRVNEVEIRRVRTAWPTSSVNYVPGDSPSRPYHSETVQVQDP